MTVGTRVRFVHDDRVGTVEGEHPLHLGWLVRFDHERGQSLCAERDLTPLSEPRSFQSSGRAYDACQCDDTIKNGTVLVCEREGVVGLAWTWPVAVSAEYGALHTPAVHGDLRALMNEAGWDDEHVRAAVALCRARGIRVNDVFLEVL